MTFIVIQLNSPGKLLVFHDFPSFLLQFPRWFFGISTENGTQISLLQCFRSTFQVLISHAGWSWAPLDRESTLVMLVGMIHIYIYTYIHIISISIYIIYANHKNIVDIVDMVRTCQNVSFWRVSMRKNRVTTAFSWSSLGKGCISLRFLGRQSHIFDCVDSLMSTLD